MLLFFDFSAMEPDEIDRAVDAGKKYVQANMQPADMVALVSLATSMRLDLDFTDNKAKILSALSAYNDSEGQGFESGTLYPVELSVEMARAIPQSQLWILPNRGHGPVFGEKWPDFQKTAVASCANDSISCNLSRKIRFRSPRSDLF
jgi:hypothetical protein